MDAPTVATIASTAVSLLVPYLTKLADSAAIAAAKRAGTKAWDKATQLYDAVKANLSSEGSTALTALETSPDDPDTQAAVRFQLQELMARNEALGKELAAILKDADAAGADSVFNTTIHGSVEKLTNIGTVHGDVSF